jgi:anti-anti-sigma factor
LHDFQVTEEVRDDVRIVRVRGELDLEVAERMEEMLAGAAADPSRGLVIDLAGCEFVDSAGLTAILHGAKPFQDGESKVAIACPEGNVRKLLNLTGIDQTLPVFDSEDAAVQAALASD